MLGKVAKSMLAHLLIHQDEVVEHFVSLRIQCHKFEAALTLSICETSNEFAQ